MSGSPQWQVEVVELRGVLAGRIRVAMTRRRLSARALAIKAGVTDVTIGNVLEGRQAQLDTILKIAFALELSLPVLFAPRASADLNRN